MPANRRHGRLFWKLLFAVASSMLLTVAGAIGYLLLTGHSPPKVDGQAMWGPIPLVPLISATVAIFGISLGLAWYLSRPLRHLSWALGQFADGMLDTRAAPLMGGRRDEITDLAQDFDRMAERIELLTQVNRDLMHDISHELRSPLSRLQAAIGLIDQDPSQTAEMIQRISHESSRLDALIEQLLTLHRLNAGSTGTPRQRIDVIELLQAIAEDAEFEARAVKQTLRFEATGRFITLAHGELLYRAFENVIRNALKFSPPNGEIYVAARIIDDGARLVVEVLDRGPGVPPNMLNAIFDPFTRVPGSDQVRGTGLGLAITRRAMVLHDGRIDASLRDGGGLTMRLTLPRRD